MHNVHRNVCRSRMPHGKGKRTSCVLVSPSFAFLNPHHRLILFTVSFLSFASTLGRCRESLPLLFINYTASLTTRLDRCCWQTKLQAENATYITQTAQLSETINALSTTQAGEGTLFPVSLCLPIANFTCTRIPRSTERARRLHSTSRDFGSQSRCCSGLFGLKVMLDVSSNHSQLSFVVLLLDTGY